jgi:hypothetical protein
MVRAGLLEPQLCDHACVPCQHGTRGHAQWSGRNPRVRLEDTPLRLPEMIGEPNEKGNLKTDQRRRETMGPPKRGDPHGGRVPVVLK